MRHTFNTSHWIAAPVDLVFAFFANPENLPRLMPRWQSTRIEEAVFSPPPPRPVFDPLANLTAPHLRSFAAGAGTTLTVSFRPFPYSPIRIPWEVRILEFVWNSHFRDQQVRGPFTFWDQTHRTISEFCDGIPGTRVEDQIEYEVPFGLFGDIANSLLVARQIRYIFRHRQHRLHQLLNIPALDFRQHLD